MCLNISSYDKTKVRKLRKIGKPITAWKVLKASNISPYQRFTYQNGLNVSNRGINYLTKIEKEEAEVSKGFHCYCTRKDAREYVRGYGFPSYRHILKVTIDPNDLVAYGTFSNRPSLVCTRLTIQLNKKG